MDFDISKLNNLNLDQLKNLCLESGISIQIERQDLISRLTAKFSRRSNTTEGIIQIKQEFTEDTSKFNVYSNSQSKTQYIRTKSVASDHGTLNSDLSFNFGPDSSPSNSTSFTGITKPAPATLSNSNFINILNTHNGEKSKPSKTFSFTSIAIKEKVPISAKEELERRQKRAERFNGSAPSHKKNTNSLLVPSNLPVAGLAAVSSLPLEEKLRKRAERFGIEKNSAPSKIASAPPNIQEKPLENKLLIAKNKAIEQSKEKKKKLFIEEDRKKLEARSKRFTAGSLPKVITREDPKKLLQRTKRFRASV